MLFIALGVFAGAFYIIHLKTLEKKLVVFGKRVRCCLLKVLDWSVRAGYLMWCKWSNAQTRSSVPPRSWVDSGTPVRFSRRCFLPCFLARRCRNCCVLGTRSVFHPHLIVLVCPVKVPLKLIFILYLFRCYTCCYRVSCGISWTGVVWHRWAAHGNCLSLSPFDLLALVKLQCLASSFILPHIGCTN